VDQELVITPAEASDSAFQSRPPIRRLCRCILALLLIPGSVIGGIGDKPEIDVLCNLTLAPSVLTSAADASWIVGLDQTDKPRYRAVRLKKAATVEPFPTENAALGDKSAEIVLDAIEALQTDHDGLIWALDNGRRSEIPPKIVAWDDRDQKVTLVRNLAPPATLPGSFLADFVVDPHSPLIVISDPANGNDAALILLDRNTGIARRILEGHVSLTPDRTSALPLPRGVNLPKRLDGSPSLPRNGVRPLALDRKAEWLYFAAVQSHTLYRLPMRLLRKSGTPPAALLSALEPYAKKPHCCSIVIDFKNNIHLGDLQSHSIGVIEGGDRSYRTIASDARLLWPDGLCFGQDGKLYFFSRLLAPNPKRSDAVQHPIFSIQPIGEGRAGD